ncbi:MAG: DUF3293 domain-containing protein [Pseudomonadales bacterium]|nr:DUF3293 domain-containing protein [Pseudomonadales bacterium]
MDSNLLEKYRAADYIVDDDPPLVLRVDEQNDGVRVLFASFNVETGAFITAWNPASDPLSLDENYDRQAGLLSEIESLRLNYFVGRGEDPGGEWYEESYFVLGVTMEQAKGLAEQFGQNAFVWVPPSGVPELVLTSAAEGP